MTSGSSNQTKSTGTVFKTLTFLIALAALIIAVILYFRVANETSRSANYISEGAVSLKSFEPNVARQLEDAISYYNTLATNGAPRDGVDGKDGADGARGIGVSGQDGQAGSDGVGIQGSRGDDGTTGAAGEQGAVGLRGAQGPRGNTGLQGAPGEKGEIGARGATGEKGDKGDTGDSGVLSTAFGNGLSGEVSEQTLILSLVTNPNGGLAAGANGLALTSSCTSSQILKYSGAAWVCASDEVGEIATANLTSATAGVTVSGGVGAVLGSGAAISIATATGSQNGLLSSADWTTFNNKSNALSFVGRGLFSRAGDTVTTLACTSGQITVFNGTNWVCANNSDSDTVYSAGAGLALAGSVFSLDPSSLTGVSSVGASDSFVVSTAAGARTISYNDLFSGILGSLNYRGTWNADTNAPDLSSVCTPGTKGYYYVVNAPGSTDLSGITVWNEGDWVVCNGTDYEKIETTNLVSSVHGRTGAVTAQNGDYTAAQITNTPAGGVSATTVQGAINELENEKLNKSLSSGQVWIGGGSNLAQAVTISGDATLTDTGVITISNGAVTADKIADGVLTLNKIGSNGCTNGQTLRYSGTAWVCGAAYSAGEGIEIDSNLVISSTLGSSIDTAELADGAVTTVKLADSSITSQKILNGTITFEDWGSNGCTAGQIPRFNGSLWECVSLQESSGGATVTATSPIATAQADTTVTLGEFTFRYNRNTTSGNLEIRSSSSSSVPFRATAEERFPSSGGVGVRSVGSLTAPANTSSTFLEVAGGGASMNELLMYQIWTQTRMYEVYISNFNSTNISIWVRAN